MIKSKKVVVIMTDTQRWDMINAYRNTGLKTPCLDKMCAEGTRCEYAYTTQPVCQPARAGIFTGQYPSSCGSWVNTVSLPQTCPTIGERLQAANIHTAYIGKWHLDGIGYFGRGSAPEGWDDEYWYDMTRYLGELTEEQRKDVRQLSRIREKDLPEEIMFGHGISKRAIDFLEKHNDEDFLLCVSYDEPHGPFACPQKYQEMYKDYDFPRDPNLWADLETQPEHHKIWGAERVGLDRNTCTRIPSEFFACNSYVDYEIGKVLDAVEKYAKDAVVIYTSDHGDAMDGHGITSKGPSTYDEVARIPFIIKGPNVPAGAVDKNPVSHINIAPTIFDMMDIDIPPVFPGESLAAEIADPENVRTNDYVFIEYGRYESGNDQYGGFQPMRGVYDGKYKLTLNLLSSDSLYDYENDPQEMNNLINDPAYFEIRNKLHDAILINMARCNDQFRGYYWECRPWRTDAPKPDWCYVDVAKRHPELVPPRREGKRDNPYNTIHYNYETGERMD